MIASNMGWAPVEFPLEADTVANCGTQGPMSLQHAVGSHGHEMHPQKFVRLVGCNHCSAGIPVSTNDITGYSLEWRPVCLMYTCYYFFLCYSGK